LDEPQNFSRWHRSGPVDDPQFDRALVKFLNQALGVARINSDRTIVDLTERRFAEESRYESEKRYHALFDLVPVAVYSCDAEGLIQELTSARSNCGSSTGPERCQREIFAARPKIFYPDGRPMPHEKCPMARVLRGEKLKQNDLEILIERPDGRRRSVIASPRR